MERENKKLKITTNKKVVSFSLIALVLLVLVSTSYAYFTAVIEGNDTAKQASVTSGTMSVELINTEEINLNGMMPGESTTVHFSVKNTGKAPATYGVGLLVTENGFVDKSDLVYTITSDNDGGSKTESILPSESTTPTTLIPVVSIPVGITQNYTMTITFKNRDYPQNDNQGKAFGGKVQLVGTETNMLATRILSDNTVKTDPVWSSTSTDVGVYKLSREKTIDGNPTYYYRGNVENNYVKFGTNGYYPIFYTTSKEVSDRVYSCIYNSSTNEEMNDCVNNEAAAIMITPMGADLIWRIVRIAEDGSIRLILDTNESQLFRFQYDNYTDLGQNFEEYNLQYYGVIRHSPIDPHSPISLELYDFVNNSLTTTEQSKLYTSKICNTGLITEDNITIYNDSKYVERALDDLDAYRCIEEEKIDVSVSMITAPEVYYASTNGVTNGSGPHASNKSYFNSFADKGISDGFLTMSAGDDGSYDYINNYTEAIGKYVTTPYTVYTYNNSGFDSVDYIGTNYNTGTYIGIRPVINLNPNIKVLNSGNGTKDNPYVIE